MSAGDLTMRRSLPGVLLWIPIHAAVLFPLAGRPAAAREDVPKPAWQWTLDERLAARFDPEAMAAREAERQARQAKLHPVSEKADTTEPAMVQEVIYGNKAPELLLPVEIFDVLLERGFPSDQGEEALQQSRAWIEEQTAALGFGRDFLPRLERTAAPYLKLLHEADQRPVFQVRDDGNPRPRLCRARAQALKAAQAEFGREPFLRLLYEAIAPSVSIGRLLGPSPPDYKRYADDLRFQEKGCQ